MGNIAKDDLDLPTDESRWDELKEEFSALTTWLKVTLADRIEKAEISQSLVTSPAMRRIIKSQASAGEWEKCVHIHDVGEACVEITVDEADLSLTIALVIANHTVLHETVSANQ